ncbi:hypothetical protein AAEI01_21190 [Shewanella xiamenensis]
MAAKRTVLGVNADAADRKRGVVVNVAGVNQSQQLSLGVGLAACIANRSHICARCDSRRIVRASQGDGDCVGRAAHRLHGKTVSEGFACLELLNRALTVVGAVVPLTVGVEAERAVTARHIGLCGEMVLARIRIGDCQLSRCADFSSRHVTVFSDCAAINPRNHGAVIMAVDGHCDGVGRAVHRLHGQAVGQCGVLT